MNQSTRIAVLCSLLIRVNGPVNVFMLNFACNGQTSVILFVRGAALSIHCLVCSGGGSFVFKKIIKKSSLMSYFAPGEAAPLIFDSQKKSVPLGLCRTQDEVSLSPRLGKQFPGSSLQ